MDGYPKRQAEKAELCGAGTEVPHSSANSKAVRGVASEIGVHIKQTQANKNRSVQTDCGEVAVGYAVFGAADTGEAAGDGI